MEPICDSSDTVYVLQKEYSSDEFLRLTNVQSIQNNEKLISAVDRGDEATVHYVLAEGGLNLDYRGLAGASALHYSSRRGNVQIVSALIKVGFHVNARNDAGDTPLHQAVYYGHLLVVEQLLDNNANIDSVNNYNETPLICAAQKAMPAVVRILLSRGADQTIRDRYGDTAADVAVDSRTISTFQAPFIVESPGSLAYDQVVNVFSFLNAKEIARCSMVCGKWHRASNYEALWTRLGVRRWELALQSSLGFAPLATASFRPKINSKKKAPTTIFRASSL